MIFKRYHKYGPLNSHDVLKFSAIVLMVIDHVGAYLLPDISELRLIGRFAMPLFLFLVGYSLHYQWKWSLLLWACVLLAGSLSAGYPLLSFNILFSILLTRLFLRKISRWPSFEKNLPAVFIACIIWYIPTSILFDYGSANFLFGLCGYMVASNIHPQKTQLLILLTVCFHTLTQAVDHGFSWPQSAWVWVGLLLVGLLMRSYQLRRYPATHPVLATPAMFISRYSLEIYAIHLVIFKWIATLLT